MASGQDDLEVVLEIKGDTNLIDKNLSGLMKQLTDIHEKTLEVSSVFRSWGDTNVDLGAPSGGGSHSIFDKTAPGVKAATSASNPGGGESRGFRPGGATNVDLGAAKGAWQGRTTAQTGVGVAAGGGGGGNAGLLAGLLGGMGGGGGGSATIGQARGLPLVAGIGAVASIGQTIMQMHAQKIAAQADPSASLALRQKAIEQRAVGNMGATAVGAAIGTAVLGPGVGTAIGAMMGPQMFGGIGEIFAAQTEFEAAGLNDVQRRMTQGRGMMRRVARGGVSRGAHGAGQWGGARRAGNLGTLSDVVGMGFSAQEAAGFSEAGGVGVGGMGLGTQGWRMFGRPDLAQAQFARAGFNPMSAVGHLSAFRGGGGFTAGGGANPNEPGMRPQRLASTATAFGLSGTGVDTFMQNNSRVAAQRAGRGLTVNAGALENFYRRGALNDDLSRSGTRMPTLAGNLLESGMGLRDNLVGQIGGVANQMAQFQTFGRGARRGGLMGGLRALEGQTIESRRAGFSRMGGILGQLGMAHAAGGSLREARGLRDMGGRQGGVSDRELQQDPNIAAHGMFRTQADIATDGSTAYKTGEDERKGELDRFTKALSNTNGAVDRLIDVLESNTDALFQAGMNNLP